MTEREDQTVENAAELYRLLQDNSYNHLAAVCAINSHKLTTLGDSKVIFKI